MRNKRIFLIRCLAVLALLLVAAVMMVIGRGHTVYFDNKNIEYEGTTYEAPYKTEVFVKGDSVGKLYNKAREDRGMATTMGQSFKFSLKITETKGGDPVMYDLSMKSPYSMDGIVLNIPALLEGLPKDAYLSEFIPAVVEEPTEEETTADEFGLGEF